MYLSDALTVNSFISILSFIFKAFILFSCDWVGKALCSLYAHLKKIHSEL